MIVENAAGHIEQFKYFWIAHAIVNSCASFAGLNDVLVAQHRQLLGDA